MILPDPTFQGGAGGVGSVVLLDESQFTDPDGNPIPDSVLDATTSLTRDPTTGQIYIDSSAEGAVGGPAGPSSADC